MQVELTARGLKLVSWTAGVLLAKTNLSLPFLKKLWMQPRLEDGQVVG